MCIRDSLLPTQHAVIEVSRTACIGCSMSRFERTTAVPAKTTRRITSLPCASSPLRCYAKIPVSYTHLDVYKRQVGLYKEITEKALANEQTGDKA